MNQAKMTTTRGLLKASMAIALAATFFVPALASAQVENVLRLQGRLVSAAGTPVPDGDYGIAAAFYKTKTDTKALYVYTSVGVKVKGGAFSMSIGEKTGLDLKPFLSRQAGWVGLQIGSDPELPRIALHLVPYAISAQRAGDLVCSGCVGKSDISSAVLTEIEQSRDKALTAYAKKGSLAKVATSGKYADLSGKPVTGKLAICPSGEVLRGYKTDGAPVCVKDAKGQVSGADFALSNQGCKAGQYVASIGKDGKVVCATDKTHALSTLDKRYVNEGQADSITGGMVKNSSLTGSDIANGSLTGSDIKGSTLTGGHIADSSLTGADIKNGTIGSADINSSQIQRRVVGKCAAGQAVVDVLADGKVKCAATLSEQSATGKVASGIWYRIAATKNGYGNAEIQIKDTTYGDLVRFRVGIVAGYGSSTMTADLVEHTRGSSLQFSAIRVAEGSSSQAVLIDVRASRAASTKVVVLNTSGKGAFAPAAFTLLGTSPKYATGYAVREYKLDNRVSWGDTASRIVIDRSNRLGIGGQPSYPLHVTTATSSWQARFTNGKRNTYINSGSGNGIHVNTGAGNATSFALQLHNGSAEVLLVRNDGNIYANGKKLRDAGGGWVRTHGATGWYSETYGGGIYMTDKNDVRVYGSKRFRVDNYLGVGSTPGHPVDVDLKISNNWQARFVNGSTQVYLSHEKGHGMYVQTNNQSGSYWGAQVHNGKRSIFLVRNDGRVGINANTTSLSYNLQVVGTTYLGGDVRGAAHNGSLRLRSSSGYVDIGAQNSSYLHFSTDRSKFYFNKRIYVDENIVSSHDGDFYLQRAGSNKLRLDSGGAYVWGTLVASSAVKIGSTHVAKGNTACGSGQALYGHDKNGNPRCRQVQGVVYTAWGRTSCPTGSLVYRGRTAGDHHGHGGGGVDYQCMRRDPNYISYNDGNQNGGLLYRTEYQTSGYGAGYLTSDNNYEVPCAVCYRGDLNTKFMQPGNTGCPSGFTRAYYGYLMSAHYQNGHPTNFICVYYSGHRDDTGNGNHDNSLVYPVESENVHGYVHNREVSCAMCLR